MPKLILVISLSRVDVVQRRCLEPLTMRMTLELITFRLQFLETFEAQFLFPLRPR
jgi:hypothetical protein